MQVRKLALLCVCNNCNFKIFAYLRIDVAGACMENAKEVNKYKKNILSFVNLFLN